MKKLSVINKIIYLLNSVLATVLLLSYLLPLVSPEKIPAFAILSLFVPTLIILNIFFVIYWIIKLKKQFFLSAIILVIGWFFSNPPYKLTENKSRVEGEDKDKHRRR